MLVHPITATTTLTTTTRASATLTLLGTGPPVIPVFTELEETRTGGGIDFFHLMEIKIRVGLL